ncbi:MAG: ATP-binding protein [Clostridia bacterium]|nr:ATP-binding protein [Clostridia bacterium]
MNITNFISDLEKKAAERITTEPDDYIGEDGLLYCGKCHTKKQTRIFLFGEERTPPCLCKCRQEQRDREEAEHKRILFEDKVKRLRQMGFPEREMQEWTFANADGSNEKLISAAQRYVDNFKEFRKNGKGLLLFGTVGTGKTFISACIANALIDRGYPVLMTNFARIANTVSGMWEGKQEYYDSLNDYQLLVLDDLAAERKTEYMSEIVFNVIDARYRAGLPLIVTTNLTSEELKHPADISYQRTFSRLLEMCIPVEVEGKDKRLEKLKADIKPMKDLLGL